MQINCKHLAHLGIDDDSLIDSNDKFDQFNNRYQQIKLNDQMITLPIQQVSNIDRAHLIDWIAKIHNAIEGLK
jgi:hypothetical protein